VSAQSGSRYLLDNPGVAAGGRFEALAALFDPVTFRHVDALGISAGWRCWEVGAGGASVPDGLANRVGPGRQVVASDIDTGWLAGQVRPEVEVVRHDVVTDDPPGDGFNLIHARLVLLHLPERHQALQQMVSRFGLRGGCWSRTTTPPCKPRAVRTCTGPDQQLANKVKDAFRALLFARGVDAEFGRRLPRLLRGLGLRDVTPMPTSRWRARGRRAGTRPTSTRFATASSRPATSPVPRSRPSWPCSPPEHSTWPPRP
jgi:hypothetical protein